MSTGLIHIYTGKGKGKTTAAVGLAIRAKSRGLKVLFAQFMKDGGGEVEILEKVGVEVVVYDRVLSTVFNPDADRDEIRNEALRALESIKTRLPEFDLAILDEFIYVMDEGLITEDEAIKLINEKPEGVELVLTGRGATEALINVADHVTEMKDVKHPFQEGISARPGIDY